MASLIHQLAIPSISNSTTNTVNSTTSSVNSTTNSTTNMNATTTVSVISTSNNITTTDDLMSLYILTKKSLSEGGIQRWKYTIPALVFACLKLCKLVHFQEHSNSITGSTSSTYPTSTISSQSNNNTTTTSNNSNTAILITGNNISHTTTTSATTADSDFATNNSMNVEGLSTSATTTNTTTATTATTSNNSDLKTSEQSSDHPSNKISASMSSSIDTAAAIEFPTHLPPPSLSPILHETTSLQQETTPIQQQEYQPILTSSIVPVQLQYTSKKILLYVFELITLITTTYSEISLLLYLETAQLADEYSYTALAYEFYKEGFLLYECEITETKAQIRCLTAMIGSLLTSKNLSNIDNSTSTNNSINNTMATVTGLNNNNSCNADDYEALVIKVTQYCNKLLKKSDQCRLIIMAAHLYWYTPSSSSSSSSSSVSLSHMPTKDGNNSTNTNNIVIGINDIHTTISNTNNSSNTAATTPASINNNNNLNISTINTNRYTNPTKVSECLQKSVKLATSVMDPHLCLEILDR